MSPFMVFVLSKLGCDALDVRGWRRWYVALLAFAVLLSTPLTWWLLLIAFAFYMQDRRNARKKALNDAEGKEENASKPIEYAVTKKAHEPSVFIFWVLVCGFVLALLSIAYGYYR